MSYKILHIPTSQYVIKAHNRLWLSDYYRKKQMGEPRAWFDEPKYLFTFKKDIYMDKLIRDISLDLNGYTNEEDIRTIKEDFEFIYV